MEKSDVASISNHEITQVKNRLDKCIKEEIDTRERNGDIENRSQELDCLTHEFQKMKLRYHKLVSAAKEYHRNAVALNKSRLEVVREIVSIVKRTPIQHQITNEDETTKCFSNVYNLADKLSTKDAERYQRNIIDYAVEWGDLVISRIDNEIAESKKMLSVKLHYDIKLPQIRKKVVDLEVKGKTPSPQLVDKLKRNEEKFIEARLSYEEHAFALVVLIEESIICSWKDIFPLIINMMKWEAERSYGEHAVFKNLKSGLLEDLNMKFATVKDYKAVRMIEKNARTKNVMNSL